MSFFESGNKSSFEKYKLINEKSQIGGVYLDRKTSGDLRPFAVIIILLADLAGGCNKSRLFMPLFGACAPTAHLTFDYKVWNPIVVVLGTRTRKTKKLY